MIFWGRQQGIPVVKSILENEFLYVETMNFGASLLVLKDKRTGKDIVLGADNLKDYLALLPYYVGSSVGRVANRIADGKFFLTGQEISLQKNNDFHSLHGGDHGFHQKVFAVKEKENEVIYTTISEDNESGYPGNLQVEISYQLDGETLIWKATGKCDSDTLFSPTNHSYFNLLGSTGRTILGHQLFIPANRVGLVDETGLAFERTHSVKGTAFDFLEKKKIGLGLRESHENIRTAKGYDHPYLFEKGDLRAQLECSDLRLSVFSDYPVMHLYSGNYLPGSLEGKGGYCYGKHDGICFECQHYPNAIQYLSHESPFIEKNKLVTHWIKYKIERLSL